MALPISAVAGWLAALATPNQQTAPHQTLLVNQLGQPRAGLALLGRHVGPWDGRFSFWHTYSMSDKRAVVKPFLNANLLGR